jgi:hypothetical protein
MPKQRQNKNPSPFSIGELSSKGEIVWTATLNAEVALSLAGLTTGGAGMVLRLSGDPETGAASRSRCFAPK